jgi:glycosyltransferase involved in cell wall biosynthesis
MNTQTVAFFLQSLAGGGAQRMMLNLAREFANRGAKVDIVLVRKEGSYLPLVPSSVRLVDLQAKRTIRSIGPLTSYLKQERPTALLSTFVNMNVVALLARRLACVPTRVVVREPNYASIYRSKRLSPLLRLGDRLQPWVYRWADGVIAVSQGVAQDMIDNHGVSVEHMHVINNPVLIPELLGLASEPLDHPWFKAGESPVLLGVGSLTEQKDFPTLIHAFAKVRQQRPARLVILGEGPDRTSLGNLCRTLGVQEDVDLPGFFLNPYAFMGRAAAFVLSSRWEGSPNVVVEAMACGCPVIATDCPSGPSEILKGGRFGMLVPVGDSDSLAQAILATLETSLSAEVIQRRANDYKVETSAEQYLDILLGKNGT